MKKHFKILSKFLILTVALIGVMYGIYYSMELLSSKSDYALAGVPCIGIVIYLYWLLLCRVTGSKQI